jgi:hypothetical protein
MFCTQRFSKKSLIVPAMFILASFLGVSAFGADNVKGNIPFAFQAGTKSLPAGSYQFRIDRVAYTVTVIGPKSNDSMLVPFVTTLAANAHSNATDADLVFDKVGSSYTLSELWLPNAEGVLVHATKGKHEHNIIHLEPSALRSDSR